MGTLNDRGEWTPFRGGHTCSDGGCSCEAAAAEPIYGPLNGAPRSGEASVTDGRPSPAEFEA